MFSTTSIQFDNMLDRFKKSRPFFQISVALLLFGTLLSLFQVTFGALSMTASQIVTFELWRLVTNVIVERNLLLLLWSLWCAHMASSIIGPVWGDVEMLKYCAIVQVLSSLLIASFALFSYIIQKNYTFFYHMGISGAASLCAAFYVAIKQFLPDSILLSTRIGRLKNTHLPGCALVGIILLTLLGAVRAIVILQVAFGIQIGWTYLRFYQPHEDGEPSGDSSDHFAWATLFPSKLQPLMTVISGIIFSTLIRLRLCKPIVKHIDVARLDSVNIILPALQTKDTERRRQKALRDLTERLSRAQRVETGSWPDMEDIDENTQVTDAASVTVTNPLIQSVPSEQVHQTTHTEQEEEEETKRQENSNATVSNV